MVRQPQQTGAWPVCAGPAVGEHAVVVAAAHAQAIAPGIEADQWHEHQIQPPGTDLPAGVGSRFTDAVSVGGPALAGASAGSASDWLASGAVPAGSSACPVRGRAA